ncbi:hypothetical protein ABH935_001650 [Catenulispora sp. GAS73]|uniref:hypothetical protein n=1 Tax=Catenulispora sp. GAS73 TaxID=3156269 RepID=UPI003516B5CF
MGNTIEIVIGMAVKGDEGFVGEVERIDLDPTGTFAVQVALRPRHEGGIARLIPMTALEVAPAEVGPDGLRLRCTLEEFEQFPPVDVQGSR